MSGPTCAVCGMGGYWVAYSPPHGENRCVNHYHVPHEPDQESCRSVHCDCPCGHQPKENAA